MAFPRPMPPRPAMPSAATSSAGVPSPAQVMLAYSRTQPGFRPENEINDLVAQYRQIAGQGKAFAKKAKPTMA